MRDAAVYQVEPPEEGPLMPSPKLLLWIAAVSLGTQLALESYRRKTGAAR